jgi:hypothetical protein
MRPNKISHLYKIFIHLITRSARSYFVFADLGSTDKSHHFFFTVLELLSNEKSQTRDRMFHCQWVHTTLLNKVLKAKSYTAIMGRIIRANQTRKKGIFLGWTSFRYWTIRNKKITGAWPRVIKDHSFISLIDYASFPEDTFNLERHILPFASIGVIHII